MSMRRDQPPYSSAPSPAILHPAELTRLQSIFRNALRAVLASSLSIAACGSDESQICTSGSPLTIDGLNPASKFDFAALRIGYGDIGPASPQEIARTGKQCDGASDATVCEAALAKTADGLELSQTCGMIQGCRKYVVTTTADAVQRYASREELLKFLGPIDSPDDALLLLYYDGFSVECDDTVARRTEKGFRVNSVDSTPDCQPVQLELEVSTDGKVREVSRKVGHVSNPVCAGRRPEGFMPAAPASHGLGAYFAAMAQLEGASVAAFDVLAIELAHHGAPPELIEGARAAARDEVRHAAVTARLARRFGAVTNPARVKGRTLRTLEEIAIDNAAEGCVRETFGALLGHHQAAAATDAEIASVMRDIAADETRHAALAHQLEAWLEPHLSPEARTQVVRARHEAVRALECELREQTSTELQQLAGVPTANAALQLHAMLEHTLWHLA